MSLRLFFRGSLTLIAVATSPILLCAANLEWSNPRVEQAATLDQEKAEASFHFKNTSTQKISIVDIRTSCGCTTATLEQRTYAPGEEGEIKAVFNLTGRSGIQEKVIQVLSDDAPEKPASLVFIVSIPEAFTIEPRLLIWKKSDAPAEPAEQSATLISPHHIPFLVRSVQSENPDFEAKLVTEEEGQRFRIVVKPKSSSKEGRTTVRIQFEGPLGHARTASVYGLIK